MKMPVKSLQHYLLLIFLLIFSNIFLNNSLKRAYHIETNDSSADNIHLVRYYKNKNNTVNDSHKTYLNLITKNYNTRNYLYNEDIYNIFTVIPTTLIRNHKHISNVDENYSHFYVKKVSNDCLNTKDENRKKQIYNDDSNRNIKKNFSINVINKTTTNNTICWKIIHGMTRDSVENKNLIINNCHNNKTLLLKFDIVVNNDINTLFHVSKKEKNGHLLHTYIKNRKRNFFFFPAKSENKIFEVDDDYKKRRVNVSFQCVKKMNRTTEANKKKKKFMKKLTQKKDAKLKNKESKKKEETKNTCAEFIEKTKNVMKHRKPKKKMLDKIKELLIKDQKHYLQQDREESCIKNVNIEDALRKEKYKTNLNDLSKIKATTNNNGNEEKDPSKKIKNIKKHQNKEIKGKDKNLNEKKEKNNLQKKISCYNVSRRILQEDNYPMNLTKRSEEDLLEASIIRKRKEQIGKFFNENSMVKTTYSKPVKMYYNTFKGKSPHYPPWYYDAVTAIDIPFDLEVYRNKYYPHVPIYAQVSYAPPPVPPPPHSFLKNLNN